MVSEPASDVDARRLQRGDTRASAQPRSRTARPPTRPAEATDMPRPNARPGQDRPDPLTDPNDDGEPEQLRRRDARGEQQRRQRARTGVGRRGALARARFGAPRAALPPATRPGRRGRRGTPRGQCRVAPRGAAPPSGRRRPITRPQERGGHRGEPSSGAAAPSLRRARAGATRGGRRCAPRLGIGDTGTRWPHARCGCGEFDGAGSRIERGGLCEVHESRYSRRGISRAGRQYFQHAHLGPPGPGTTNGVQPDGGALAYTRTPAAQADPDTSSGPKQTGQCLPPTIYSRRGSACGLSCCKYSIRPATTATDHAVACGCTCSQHCR